MSLPGGALAGTSCRGAAGWSQVTLLFPQLFGLTLLEEKGAVNLQKPGGSVQSSGHSLLISSQP